MVGDREDPVIVEVDKRLENLFEGRDESRGPGKGERGMALSPLWDLKAIILSIDWEITNEIMTRLMEQIGRAKNAYKEERPIAFFLQLLDSVLKYIRENKAHTHPDAKTLLNSVYAGLEKVALSKEISNAEKEQTLLFEIKKFKELKKHIALHRAQARKRKEMPPPDDDRDLVGEEVEKTIPEIREIELGPPIPDEVVALRDTFEQALSHDELGWDISRQKPGIGLAPQEGNGLLEDARDEAPESEMNGLSPHEAFTYALLEIKRTIKAEFEALRKELRSWRQGR
ncbi:MAG: hypothetical protein GY849_13265 [Deltaproteobacteria bacterium]|nr:hypothetical protein [Deltaproteobacteria bacterium]